MKLKHSSLYLFFGVCQSNFIYKLHTSISHKTHSVLIPAELKIAYHYSFFSSDRNYYFLVLYIIAPFFFGSQLTADTCNIWSLIIASQSIKFCTSFTNFVTMCSKFSELDGKTELFYDNISYYKVFYGVHFMHESSTVLNHRFYQYFMKRECF